MDIQYHGANCIVMSAKEVRLVIDDNLLDVGLNSVMRSGDVALYTGRHTAGGAEARLVVDGPGEYEISGLSIVGVAAQAHIDDPGTHNGTIYKLMTDEATYLITGHINPGLSDDQLEAIGMIDVMFVPVGGSGYTLDAGGALQLIKKIEPKFVIPTHYADPAVHYPIEQQSLEQVLKSLMMEPKETTTKFRFKPLEASGSTELVILTRS